ncbi:UDP-N-acetylmuramoyl-L-alanine--D-glutamate ligase [Phyllobacterium sp. 21LDTY02-6]|uniref:UDP-N-acetylmuramoyl-L-alanine--D-glutamate ligase n=1 Tax=Phyllobacterium sp. 21LDTY02-6 TaxID=2944903 RepID=UPI00201FDA55|nr:UDP-N-acetylmuramoyl-L-alanine--D-glutamate ligase [Phyllobacterium sp. 21LDTY02-6]MCO4315972.1 UDP-N-acetylmuramoyl-L-alanine--D-glutamate ligase [Phyllobacterium sp. 21LDTY02-6]
MIAAHSMKGKIVALFGLGGSGIATARAILAGGAEVVAWDDNPESVLRARSAGVPTLDLRQADWKQFSSFVLSPGVPLTHPRPHWTVDLARAAGVEIIGDIELFVRERNLAAKADAFIAITGTNGKSTTTALIAHIIRNAGRDMQLGGNIGTAVMTLEPPADGRFYVVECSSYQIDLAPSLNPTAGILLNLTPDHLDRHGTMQHYAEIKERLVAGSDTAIIGVDDSYCAAIADRLERAGKRVERISKRMPVRNGFFADGADLFEARDGEARLIASLTGIGSLRGEHNAQNALAAIAACRTAGLSEEEIGQGLATFPGLAHRMEQVGRIGPTLFVNDSKATNAEAAAPALSSFSRIYWIAGGLPKEGGISSLSGFFPRIVKAYLVGEAAPQFAAALGDAVPFEISGTVASAVAHAAADAARDGSQEPVVLLSPACASFDQFQNFEKRGEAFRAAVLALEGASPIGGSDGKSH